MPDRRFEPFVFLALGVLALGLLPVAFEGSFDSAAAHPPADRVGGVRSVELVGHLEGPAFDVVVRGDQAYVAAGADGLRVVDVSDPGSPAEAGSLRTSRPARGVALARDAVSGSGGLSDYAFLTQLGSCTESGCEGGGLVIADISVSSAPTQTAFLEMENPGDLVVVQDPAPGSYAYVADMGLEQVCGALRVVDLSDPGAPRPISTVEYCDRPGRQPVAVDMVDGFAFLLERALDDVNADGAGLSIFYMSDPESPLLVVEYFSLSNPIDGRDLTVVDGFAYLASAPLRHGPGGLVSVDVVNVPAPVEGGFYDSPGTPEGVAVADGVAYLADGAAGLRVVDVAVPWMPRETGFYDLPGYAESVAVQDGLVYVATGSTGLYILRYGEPPPPTATPTATPTPTLQPTPLLLPRLYLPLIHYNILDWPA